jgi:hypothetical protein
MNFPRPRLHAGSTRGMTIMELLLVVSLNALIITSVFQLWTSINTHIIASRQKQIFFAEAQRITMDLLHLVQRSPQVIAVERQKITFISPHTGDTTSLEMAPGDLTLGTSPVRSAAQGCRIAAFSVRDERVTPSTGSGNAPVLLLMTLTFEDSRKNSVTFPMNVTVTMKAKDRRLD